MNDNIRYSLTIDVIRYSDDYENNFELFDKGIEILNRKLNKKDFSEFKENEREILENIFSIINK